MEPIKVYQIPSKTTPGVVYTVEVFDTFIQCNCLSFQYRNRCSHSDSVSKQYNGK